MSASLLSAVVRKIGAGRHCSKYPIAAGQQLTSGHNHSGSRTRIRRIHLGCSMSDHQDPNSSNKPLTKQAVKTMTDEDWAKRLTAEQYYVTREAGTEAPFTGKYYKYEQDGIYTCVCCGAALFSSKAKYDSGCGWPSFSETLKQAEVDGEETGILKRNDMSQGMVRIECICKNCNAHLGHVFDDGPTETKERYCINSAALKFQPRKM